MFSRIKEILFVFVLFLLFPTQAFAQDLSIGRFYSQGTSKENPDWIEVINNTDSEINFSEYLIVDIANNKLQKNFYIPANGNCVFEYGKNLNNTGDVFFLKKGEEQVDCIKYGEDKGVDCNRTEDSVEERPEDNCFTPPPSPTATPKPSPTSTPKPSPTKKPSTPRPTVILTSKPVATLEATEESNYAEASSDKPEPEVLGENVEEVLEVEEVVKESNEPQETQISEEAEETSEFNTGNFLLWLGGIITTGSLAWLGYSVYNNKRP